MKHLLLFAALCFPALAFGAPDEAPPQPPAEAAEPEAIEPVPAGSVQDAPPAEESGEPTAGPTEEPPAGPPLEETDLPAGASDVEQAPEPEPEPADFHGPRLPEGGRTEAAPDTAPDAQEHVPDAHAPQPTAHADTPSAHESSTHASGTHTDEPAEHEPTTHVEEQTHVAEPEVQDPPTEPQPQPLAVAPLPNLPRALPFLPSLPPGGWRIALLLAILTGITWGAARLLGPFRDWLAPTGLLPTLASALQQVFRVLALFFAFGVLAAILPANLQPALPWVVLAGAIAIGWSTRDVTPDFIAGVVLAAERRVKPGQWIGTQDVSGVVEQVTLRVTWIRDATGRRVAVPNRMFLRDAVITDRGQWPSLEVVLRIPGEHPPSTVRRIVEDAILVSPWSAPLPPDLVREEQEIGLWRVRARVLEGRFADRFEGALREHVEEVLTTGHGLRDGVKRGPTKNDPYRGGTGRSEEGHE